MPGEITPARTIVESEIGANGPITLARFMEIALYGEHGYYTNYLGTRRLTTLHLRKCTPLSVR